MINSKELNEALDRIGSGEFIESYLQNLNEENNLAQEYLDSKEFKDDFDELVKYLKVNNGISTDGIFYFETSTSNLERKLIKIFNTLIKTNSIKELGYTDSYFPEMEYFYNNVSFYIMHGQGSIYKASVKLIY